MLNNAREIGHSASSFIRQASEGKMIDTRPLPEAWRTKLVGLNRGAVSIFYQPGCFQQQSTSIQHSRKEAI
jgi:hypothetical protein